MREGVVLALAAVALAEAFAFALPAEAQPFHRAGFLLVIAAVVATAWRGGLAPGLVAGALGTAGIVHLFLVYGGPLGPPATRITVGGTIGAFGLGLAGLIGHLRDREMRSARALAERNRELEAANRSLRDANETLEAFSYVVSHDLKEPVRAIETLASALEEDEASRLSEEGRQMVARARRAARRLSGLVTGLLEVSRASRMDLSRRGPVVVQEALKSDECTTRFQDVLHERGARLVVAEEHGTPPVLATPGTLCLVLGNLVLNAVRHNPKVSAVVLVRVLPAAGGDLVEVSVEDDGPGFDETSRAALETLARGQTPSHSSGRFGLLIVSRTIQRLGGTLSLERSEHLGGAAVRITLPAATGSAPDRSDATRPRAPGASPGARA